MRKNRLCNIDIVLPGEAADSFERRTVDWRNLTAKPLEGIWFDRFDKTRQYIIENLNLLLGETMRVTKENIGNAPQGVDPPFVRDSVHGFLKLVDQRFLRFHFVAGSSKGSALIALSRQSSIISANW